MWALRRASNPIKIQGFGLGTARACCSKLEVSCGYVDDDTAIPRAPKAVSDGCFSLLRLYHQKHDCSNFFSWRRGLSSQAGAESSGDEDDLEEGFSELETPASTDAVQKSIAKDENEIGLISESELSGDHDDIEDAAQNELELSETETDPSEKRAPSRSSLSNLLNAIMNAPAIYVGSALSKYVEEGNKLSRDEISAAMVGLRNRRMYRRALQLLEWLEKNKKLDFDERDYASFLDLIGKLNGLQKAENYIHLIPESFRGEVVYRTLLANCVACGNLKKAEVVFNTIKDKGFPVTTFACNQLLVLYKRLDKKKIADVLLLMEKENVKLNQLSYKILIDTKGQSNDMTGMDQVVEAMKSEGIEPDIRTQAILAKHYVSGGLKEKAGAILKEMEGSNLSEHLGTCCFLLPLYAELGKADEVARIWKVCEPTLGHGICVAAIEAWGKLNKIEEAEEVFKRVSKTWNKHSTKHYTALLKVYADHKMLSKGKDLVKQMAESGYHIGPLTWDALVKLHVEAGKVEKADSILNKAQQQNQLKPSVSSYMAVMEQYAKRGDIHNTEKIFHRMREVGYVARLRQFQTLVQAYIKAETPAYGIRDRIRADNIFPNKALAAQMAQVDPFKKTAVSYLLD